MAISRARTTDSKSFDPDRFLENWSQEDRLQIPAVDNSVPDGFRKSVIKAFGLPEGDRYVYHATASVTLSDVQRAVDAGAANDLHTWYRDANGGSLPPPPAADVEAYGRLFASTIVPSKSLTGFISNAKKSSLRADIASYLNSKRVVPSTLKTPKLKTPHVNPYLDYWTWSTHTLEWAGPDETHSPLVRTSHPVQPIFMHHFGCVCPSFESLNIIKQYSADRERSVIDMGSGNGYWTLLLRRLGCSVVPIDNLQSTWRTLWISDTIITDGVQWLKRRKGAPDMILLLVYPIVGGDGFTKKVLDAYKGDVVVVAGTQNENRHTAFQDRTIEEFMKNEKNEFEMIVRIPLPSFAGKDEALYVFQKGGEGFEEGADRSSIK
ncbi:MAG: hypothetical protein Q9227_003427 [Pyrenula ochraceoflavens]